MNQELQVGVRFSDLAYMAKATLSRTITISNILLERFCTLSLADVTNKQKHHAGYNSIILHAVWRFSGEKEHRS